MAPVRRDGFWIAEIVHVKPFDKPQTHTVGKLGVHIERILNSGAAGDVSVSTLWAVIENGNGYSPPCSDARRGITHHRNSFTPVRPPAIQPFAIYSGPL